MSGDMERNDPGASTCLSQGVDDKAAAEWRRETRARLIDARMAVRADARARVAAEVATTLERVVRPEPGLTIGVYWPFRGELDLRGWMADAHGAGACVALPVVVEKAAPLEFRAWSPGCAMARGVWNIPVPAEGPPVTPDVVIAPLVGFDGGCYRLGYGGGFYDRTLAAMDPRPLVVGVGMEIAAMPTIRPQPFDIPMDVIVTGPEAVFRQEG
jgi:5,10-methenyltetrahydrofolate synthetase